MSRAKLRVNYEDLQEALNYISTINHRGLAEIELYVDGKKIEITQEEIEKWKFIGLNDVEWIMSQDFEKYYGE